MRSSATASRACSTRSRSARASRSFASSASLNLRPSAKPIPQAIVKAIEVKVKFPMLPFGSLCEMIAATPIPSARPAIACVRLRRRPKSTNTANAVRAGTSPLGVTRSSTNEPAAKTTPTVAGAPKG